MTFEPRLPDYLRHIQEAAQLSLQFTFGMDQAAFLADSRTQKAVFFNFVIVGEAAARLMDRHAAFLARHPQLPWRSMRDMRNQVVHGYITIDANVVWRTLKHALPSVLAELPAIIAAAEREIGTGAPPAPAS